MQQIISGDLNVVGCEANNVFLKEINKRSVCIKSTSKQESVESDNCKRIDSLLVFNNESDRNKNDQEAENGTEDTSYDVGKYNLISVCVYVYTWVFVHVCVCVNFFFSDTLKNSSKDLSRNLQTSVLLARICAHII